jgi:fatty-acyl-CoA synthase
VPRYIKFVDAFPMTITGKIQKFVMRDQMKQELNLSEDKTA